MSLRTKLLAAVVGLNGAILLLALLLLLGSESDSAAPFHPDYMADLLALGGAVAESEAAPRDRAYAQRRDYALRRLSDLESRGVVRSILVIEDADLEGGHHVWRAREFLSPEGPGDELADGAERQSAEDAFRQARQQGEPDPWTWSNEDTLAVVLPFRLPKDGHRRGLVARYAAAADPRSGVKSAYVVIVVGVILLTAVSFWLVSRLVIRPLAQLTEAADRIARGDFRIQVESRGTNDEFDRTTEAFRRMAREIAEYQGHLESRVLAALNRMRKAEQHLGIAQRLAATGKLASGVAHEINNPLGGMKNAVRALARGDLEPDKVQEYLDLISEGLGRVEETVKKFLSFTPRNIEPRPTDFASLAAKAAALARHRVEKGGARLEENLPEPGEVTVFGDPHELQQVALNLLLNAADAVSGREGGEVVLRVAADGEEGVLEVRDNGMGLSPEDQDRCFDMFFTTKGVGEGTGLGLAVAHTIVTNHGGRLEVESALGEGAVFRVVLPSEAAPAE